MDDATPKTKSKAALIVCLVLLAIGTAGFAFRGIARTIRHNDDFAVFHTSSRAWALGSNPYDDANLASVARNAGGMPSTISHNSANPPATFLILAPIALLSWPAAKIVWLVINVAATVAIIVGLIRLAGFELRQPRAILLAAMLLGMAPVQTAVTYGQLTLPTAACIIFACLLRRKEQFATAAILLAIATCLKPQIGVFFIAFEFVRRRFRYAGLASLFTASLLLAAVAWLAINHVPWWQAWQSNYHAFMHGGSGDPMAGNSSRYQLINLQYPLHCFFHSRMLVNTITLSFVGVLGVAAVVALHKLTGPKAELLGLSIFAVLGLLPFYHRYYDGILLAFPLAWGLLAYRPRSRLLPGAAIGLTAIFLVPGPVILYVAAGKGYISRSVAASWWWQGLIVPHQAWCILALSVVLTAALLIARGKMRVNIPPTRAESAGNRPDTT